MIGKTDLYEGNEVKILTREDKNKDVWPSKIGGNNIGRDGVIIFNLTRTETGPVRNKCQEGNTHISQFTEIYNRYITTKVLIIEVNTGRLTRGFREVNFRGDIIDDP